MSALGGFGGFGTGLGGFASLGGFGGFASSGGFGGFFGTLADAYANPVSVSALVTHRDATMFPRDNALLSVPVLPQPTNAELAAQQLERWEPWVRAVVVQQALLSDLIVSPRKNSVQVSFGGAQVVASLERPALEVFQQQLPLVQSWASLREERAAEILAQIDNQLAFLSSVVYLHPTRTPRTFELLVVAIQLAVNIEMRMKHLLACWRPVEYSAQVQPMITTPGHGALPSGHATQAYIACHVLTSLLGLGKWDAAPPDQTALQLQRQAARIATNRVVAGVHFPVDNLAGRLLGQALGEYFVAKAVDPKEATELFAYTFKTTGTDLGTKRVEFNPSMQPFDRARRHFYSRVAAKKRPSASPELAHMWTMARAEWKGKFGVPA